MLKSQYQFAIGARIRELRLARGLSQRQLALLAHKDPQSLERVENGKSCPTVFYLYEFCQALGISEQEFFDYE